MRTGTSPVPAGSQDSFFQGISCLRSGFCTAVGSYFAAGAREHPLAEDN